MSEIDSIVLNGVEYELAGGGGSYTYYSITNRLTNVSNSNGATSIREGRAYSATLALNQDASLDSITITMGGADITASAWNASTMTVSIASVTNNIVITAVASITIEVSIGSWDGAGTSRWSGVFDAREYDVYWEIPFVEGASQFTSEATAESNAFGLGVTLYNDAEMTQVAGYYYIDTAEIQSSQRSTGAQNPTMVFNTQYMIAPSGYYFRIYGIRRGPYNSNGDCFSYIQAYANTLLFKSPEEEEPEEDTTSNATRTDNDLLQVYATRSLATDTVSDVTTYEGVLEEAKNAWMHEYSGDINKIPLIIHTDQHSTMTPANSSAMWEAIDNMVSWYDISKVVNLGDTTNSYENYDDPTLGDSSLDAYLEATQNVPFSKRIEVFGNHDCMKIINASLTYIPTFPSYLNPYFKNVMARRTSNNGFHVTYDPYFNVKYVVVSAYDYVDSTHYDMVSPEQYAWLIEELSKDDGYDIIVCSHVGQPYYYDAQFSNILKARYTKTSGTARDQLSNTYSYDFTSCKTDLLVFLHGHDHSDGYSYGMGTLSQCFANYYASTRPIYFVIVDRTNKQLKVWKVTNTPAYETYTRPLVESTS